MYSETPEWGARRRKEIAEGRRFYVMTTLLAGAPDRNRRSIYDHANPDSSPVETWNRAMDIWTAEDERRLQARLSELNAQSTGSVAAEADQA